MPGGRPKQRPASETIGICLCVAFSAVGVGVFLRGWATNGATASLFQVYPPFLAFQTLALGAWLVGLGWPVRIGSSMHCNACHYTLVEPPDRLLPQCPECHNPWRNFGRASRGEPRVRRPQLAAGVLCGVLGVLGLQYNEELLRSALRNMSTPLLMSHAVDPFAPHARDAFDVLVSRTLSASETSRLAELLLDLRFNQFGLDPVRSEWLEDTIVTGILPASVTQRYYDELIDFGLEVPDECTAGELVEFEVSGLLRGGATTPLGTVWYIPAGYALTPISPERMRLPLDWRAPDQTPPGRGSAFASADDIHLRSIGGVRSSFEQAGRIRVRTTVWVVVSWLPPAFTGWKDGTPTFATPPDWVRPYEMERELIVSPRTP